MFDIRFRLLWQRTHPAAGQDPNTDIFVSAVKENHAFRYDCAIKTPLRMRLDRAQETLLPWIAFKIRQDLLHKFVYLLEGHPSQRFLDCSPPLFIQSFQVDKFLE